MAGNKGVSRPLARIPILSGQNPFILGRYLRDSLALSSRVPFTSIDIRKLKIKMGRGRKKSGDEKERERDRGRYLKKEKQKEYS